VQRLVASATEVSLLKGAREQSTEEIVDVPKTGWKRTSGGQENRQQRRVRDCG
jgi:hypothetical protein